MPNVPTLRPRHSLPWAWAASSNSGMSYFARQRRQLIEIGGSPAHVHGDDGFGVFVDGRFRQLGVDAIAVGPDIHQNGQGAGEEHCAGCGDESGVRHDDFIAGSDADGGQRDFDGVGAVGDGDAVPGLMIGGELLLKSEGLGAGRAPPDAALQHLDQGVAFQIIVDWPDGEGFVFGGGAAVDGEIGHGGGPYVCRHSSIVWRATHRVAPTISAGWRASLKGWCAAR